MSTNLTIWIPHRLSDRRDEDVAETMYKETLNVPSGILHKEGAQGTPVSTFANITQQSSSKVNRICDAFLDALRSHTSTNLQNIVTAHVCKSPPDLEAGLTLVSSLRGTSNLRMRESLLIAQ